ncbi:MAG: hypothetical protein IKT60_02325 [Clostridia bacterium]|nr:hypothetical protein [Clostridia bacterium]
MRTILSDLRDAVRGAERVAIDADGLHFYRFNAEESMLKKAACFAEDSERP